MLAQVPVGGGMSLRDLFDEAGGRVPIVDRERCVHVRLEVATCQSCVAACPHDAWILDDEQLALDTHLCDGCGICVASCPEAALDIATVTPEQLAGTVDARLVCEKVGSQPGGWKLPCVNAIGLRHLAYLYRTGLRRIEISTADCGCCERDHGTRLRDRLEGMNRVLSSRRMATISLDKASAGRGRSTASIDSNSPDEAVLSRRRFLFGLVNGDAKPKTHDPVRSDAAPGSCLPPTGEGQLAFYVPKIDPARCNGCDACVHVCTHGAMNLSPQKDAYMVDPNRCTYCGLCVDVCDQQAVSIAESAPVGSLRIPLHSQTCTACGARFHEPTPAPGQGKRCRICRQTTHQRHLYQVL